MATKRFIRHRALRWVTAVLLVASLVPLPLQAQSQWQPSSRKANLPSHLDVLQRLPAGSVTHLQRVASKSGGSWELQLPGGRRQRVIDVQRVLHDNGDVSYSGSIAGAGSAYPVRVTEGASATFGEWITPHGRFLIEAWGDDAWLIDLDHPQLRVEDADHGVALASTRARAKAPAASGARAKAGETIIDVLFVYSPDFAARYPGNAAQTRINFLVALANQILINSNVEALLRVVGVDAVGYTDANDNSEALGDLRLAADSSGTAVLGLAQVRERRLQTGADLVTLIRPHDIELRGSCGIAYLFGGGAGFGVNVLSDGFSSWSICSNETYAHEIGHNLGAEHQNGANSENAGFGTAHVVLRQFHTVMGSFGTGDPNRSLRLQRFSNPQQLCGARPCGEAGVSDNARRLRDNMVAVSGYTVAVPGLPEPPRPAAQDPDEDGDGVPESQDAFPHDPLHSSDRDFDGTPDGLDAFPDNPAESLDTDGDGTGDNADPDRDGDGVANAADALPLDRTESVDSDGDGVGNNADAFDSNRLEWGDLDGDTIGDNADPDTDGDGLADFSSDRNDLLVASIGTDRVLRLDGESGRLIAIEISESHAPLALGPKSALAWNPYRRRVEALIASEVRRYDPASRTREARVLRSFRGLGFPGLKSGLPDAMALGNDGRVYIADGGNDSLHRYDAVTAAELFGGVFSDSPFFPKSARALAFRAPASLWSLDRLGQLREIGVELGDQRRQVSLQNGAVVGPLDPSAMAFGPDGALYVADAGTDRILRVDVAAGNALSVFIGVGAGGLDRPTGLAFDTQGRLLLSNAGDNRILRFNAATGAFIDTFSQLPAGVLIEPRSLLLAPAVLDRFPRDAQRRYRPRVGAWFNPARSGQGIDLQAIPGGLAFAWYTYDEDGRATWYLAVGALQGDSWSAPLQRFTWDGSSATGSDVGTVSLAFLAEDRASFSWQLDGRSGSETIEHLQTGRSIETQFPTAVWFAPASNGWGYSVTRQGDVLAIAAFVFDRDGQPTWALGVGAANAAELQMLRLNAPNACPGCTGNTMPDSTAVGPLRFEVLDDGRARGRIELLDDDVDWQFEDLDLRRLSNTPTLIDGSPRP